jgi:hypothetical protein
VVLLSPLAYEGNRTLRALSAPKPAQEWLQVMRADDHQASWLPAGIITEGPYQGGTVVEVDIEGDRAYIAVPPEALEMLAEVMEPLQYQAVIEDLAAAANPDGPGQVVTRLDRTAWEERRQVLPTGAPLLADDWMRVIFERHLQVEVLHGALLPLDGPWRGGHVVVVGEPNGEHRSYFALPRAALFLALALEVATKHQHEIATGTPPQYNKKARQHEPIP